MSCKSIVSGLSREVAQTIVELMSIDLSEIQTTGTLSDAKGNAFQMTAVHISKK